MERNDMTFEQWQMYWYKKWFEMFGKKVADEWLTGNLNHHTIMKELWIDKGFKTYGEYVEWEQNHIDERNEYFRQKGEEI